jgi:ParB family transcriptional regulator, chromosome partitioning protein
MAKRKRLTPAQSDYLGTNSPALETKSMTFPAPRAPIAQVAGEASAAAALQELAGEVKRARDEGRMIQALATDQIEVSYLVRDRMLADGAELRVLVESLRARGQQTPIEVVALDQGRYGLISGWRRLTAMRQLSLETGDDRFATIQAILRQPETAADAYIAMVEENEIRVGLSYYERARVAAKAVEQGVFITEKEALLNLFSTASRAKRSKIRSFLTLYREAEDHLKFASAIPERLGLALIKALDGAPARAADLRAALRDAAASDAAAELACLEAVLARFGAENTRARRAEPVEKQREKPSNALPGGIELGFGYRKATLSGPGVTPAFQKRLREWLKTQN